jgi:hypothetical protein
MGEQLFEDGATFEEIEQLFIQVEQLFTGVWATFRE